jgi:hypothetical protein
MVCLLVCLALWLWCVTHKNYTAGFLLSSLLLPLAVPPLLQLLRCARSGTGLVGESCSALLLLMLLGGITLLLGVGGMMYSVQGRQRLLKKRQTKARVISLLRG